MVRVTESSYVVYHQMMSQAAMQFPELHDYADLWPITDMVRLNLKYTSGRAHLNDKVSRELAKCRPHKKQ